MHDFYDVQETCSWCVNNVASDTKTDIFNESVDEAEIYNPIMNELWLFISISAVGFAFFSW